MNNEPLHNPQNEVDIVALFEYFKNGIKSIFRTIGNFFKWIFQLFLDLLYLVYKNWILVFGLMLIFGVLGLFKNAYLSPKFKYEMIVEPKLNSTFELYNNVSNLSQIINPYFKNEEGLSGIEKLEVMPIKRYADEVRLYYSVPKNTEITGAPDMFGAERDTVFYRSVEFKDFQRDINDFDYPVQKIIVKSTNAIDTDKLKNLILEPFSKNAYWEKRLNNKKDVLSSKITIYSAFINRADSLLSAYTKNPELRNNSEINISGNNSTENVEDDLFEQVKALSSGLENVQVSLNNSQNVIEVLSDFKRVEDDSMRSYWNLFTGLIFGFVLAMLILLAKYLLKYFRNYTPSFNG